MTENNLTKMNQEPTRTIYNCLGPSFWATRKCHSCQQFFTCQDYQTNNYQLTFLQVLEINQLNLAVVVQLTHLECPGLVCCQEDNFNYQQETRQKNANH